MKTKTCDCGQEIVFAHLQDSQAPVPVEFRTPVYLVVAVGDDGMPIVKRLREVLSNDATNPAALDVGKVAVNHSRTCPKAGQFTKR